VWRRKPEAQRRRRPGRSRDLGGDEIRVSGAERRGAGEEAEVGGGGMERKAKRRWGQNSGRSTERVCLVYSRTEPLYFFVFAL
jgi:hypothetical protein